MGTALKRQNEARLSTMHIILSCLPVLYAYYHNYKMIAYLLPCSVLKTRPFLIHSSARHSRQAGYQFVVPYLAVCDTTEQTIEPIMQCLFAFHGMRSLFIISLCNFIIHVVDYKLTLFHNCVKCLYAFMLCIIYILSKEMNVLWVIKLLANNIKLTKFISTGRNTKLRFNVLSNKRFYVNVVLCLFLYIWTCVLNLTNI